MHELEFSQLQAELKPDWYYTEEGIQSIRDFVHHFAMLTTEGDEQVSDIVADLFIQLDAYTIYTNCESLEHLQDTIVQIMQANVDAFYEQKNPTTTEQQLAAGSE